jgi:hypothetical protein
MLQLPQQNNIDNEATSALGLLSAEEQHDVLEYLKSLFDLHEVKRNESKVPNQSGDVHQDSNVGDLVSKE